MIQAYPVILEEDENGFIASFPDVPEAITMGKDEKNTLDWAQDALVVALSGYRDERKDIPKPSISENNQKVVFLPPMIAIKLTIYQTMRDQNISQAELSERMEIDARQVRRILDINHNTTLPQLIRTLKVLGKKMIVEIKNAA